MSVSLVGVGLAFQGTKKPAVRRGAQACKLLKPSIFNLSSARSFPVPGIPEAQEASEAAVGMEGARAIRLRPGGHAGVNVFHVAMNSGVVSNVSARI